MTTVSSTTPTHGNYHNYHGYVFFVPYPKQSINTSQRYRYHHPGGHDSRLALLPRELLANARVLDVGCNEGWVSCEIGAFLHVVFLATRTLTLYPPHRPAQLWGARRVVGVDIDDALVRMAWRRRRTLWSHQAPISDISSSPENDTGTSRRKRKRKSYPTSSPPPPPPPGVMADYFPASCQHMFGPLPIPPTDTPALGFGVSDHEFPHNISFRRADWVNERIPEDGAGYDVIVA
jgi:7SK snRNA methylphosphate capping enzyme